MAKLPTVKTLSREDFKEADDWIVGLLNPLNSFMSSVYYALDKDLTFTENVASSVKTLTFTTRSDYTTAVTLADRFDTQRIFSPLKTKPVGVILSKIINLNTYEPIYEATGISWDYLDGYVRVNHITGLANSIKYEVTLLIF